MCTAYVHLLRSNYRGMVNEVLLYVLLSSLVYVYYPEESCGGAARGAGSPLRFTKSIIKCIREDVRFIFPVMAAVVILPEK